MYLGECIKFLENTFKSDWLDTYLIEDIETTNEVKIKNSFEADIDVIIENYSDFFIQSIITGEYVNEITFFESLEAIKKHIQNATSITVDVDKYNEVVFEKLTFLNRVLNDFISKYIGFQKYASSYKSNSNSHLIFKLEKNNTPKNFKSEKLKTFSAFISIYTFEHFLSEDFTDIIAIVEAENNLDEFINPENKYYQIFRAKILFLKFKLLYRYKLNLENNSDSEFTNKAYLFNNEEISLNKVPNNPVQYEKLKQWEEYLINHYRKDKDIDKQYFDKEFNRIKTIDINKRSILELHFCIKYFKDVCRDKNNLIEIVDEVKNRYDNSRDNFVYSKIYLYALNNLFSLYCETDKKDIQTLYDKIESLQNQTQNRNFFSSLKLLGYLSEKLFNEIDENESILNLNSYNSEFEKIEKLINKTRNRIEWSNSHQNLVFQLDYIDSLVDVSNLNFDIKNIYFPSSFVLPIATKENNDEFNRIEQKFIKYKTRYELYNKLLPDIKGINEAKEDVKEAKEEIKRIEKKSIETITIFTAIISFIVGSIGAFQFIESFSQAVLFIVLFSVSISIFVLLFFATTKGLKTMQRHWYLLLPYFLIGLIVYYFIIPFYTKDLDRYNLTIKNEKIIQRKLDSIQKINTTTNTTQIKLIDSLRIKIDRLEKIKTTPQKQGSSSQLKNQ